MDIFFCTRILLKDLDFEGIEIVHHISRKGYPKKHGGLVNIPENCFALLLVHERASEGEVFEVIEEVKEL